MPPFAFWPSPERVAQLLVNALAVAGGFLVGYAVTTVLTWLGERYVWRFKASPSLHRAVRTCGGLALALLVAFVLFGSGGTGGGSGDGTGDKAGTPNATTGEGTGPAEQPAAEVKAPAPAPVGPAPADRLRVTLLGGKDVQDQKFYLIGDDPAPRTFAEVKAAIQARKDAGKPFGLEVRFASRNMLPSSHGAVQQLTAYAREVAGVTVTFPAEGA